MPFNFGQVSEFSDTNSLKSPVIASLAKAITLPNFKGRVYQMMKPPIVALTQKKFEIYSRSRTAKGGTIGAGGWDNAATTALPLDPTSIKGLTIGMVLLIQSEVVVLNAVNQGGGTVGVTKRGAAGTVGAAHAAGVAYSVIGFAGRDTDLKNLTGTQENTLKYENYVQLFMKALDWTKGAELQRQGLSAENVVAVLQREKAIEMADDLAVASIWGMKQTGAAGGDQYMSAGLLQQLADDAGGTRPVQLYNAAGAFTEIKLRAALKQITKVGAPNRIILSSDNKEVANAFAGAGSPVVINTDRKDPGRGVNVEYYDYQGLRLTFEVDADMPNDRIAIVNEGSMWKGWLSDDELTYKEEPSLSTRERRTSIQGSVGFGIENVGYEHILIHGIT